MRNMDCIAGGTGVSERMTPREKLAWLIRVKGLRRGYVAAEAGISVSYLSRLTSGDRGITPEMAKRLAKPLGVSPEELLGGRR